MIKLPHLSMKPTELPPGFGLRWQAKRDTALVEDVPNIRRPAELESAVAAVLQSSLRFASAGCRRSPKRQPLRTNASCYSGPKLKALKWN
jgi:hypothetical protein